MRRLVVLAAGLAVAVPLRAQVSADSARRVTPDALATGMWIEARFSAPREVVVLMPDGGTLTLDAVRSLIGRVSGVSEQRLVTLRVQRVRVAAGGSVPRGYSRGTAFVISDSTVTFATVDAPGAGQRAGMSEWLMGALVPFALFVYILRYGL